MEDGQQYGNVDKARGEALATCIQVQGRAPLTRGSHRQPCRRRGRSPKRLSRCLRQLGISTRRGVYPWFYVLCASLHQGVGRAHGSRRHSEVTTGQAAAGPPEELYDCELRWIA